MEFKLFGRLRDDGQEAGDNRSSPQGPAERDKSPGLGGDASLGGGSVERTVENMFQQGYSEEDIKQELQGQYPPERINEAINNAVASSATTQGSQNGPEAMTPYQGESDAVSPVDEGFSQDAGNDTMDNQPVNNQPDTQQQQSPPPQQSQEPIQAPEGQQDRGGQPAPSSNVEELVETIVAENFERVEREFENVYSEIDELKEHAEDLEQRVHDLEVRDDEDNQQFIQKVDEMEEHIDSYQSRIGGLEKAFQQVLPSLVDNVRDLTELVQEIKTERGIDTDKNVSKQDIDDIDVEDWD